MNESGPPAVGVCLPVRVVRVIDGDTVVVRVPGIACEWHLRLIDVWAAERNTDQGQVAKAWLEHYLAANDARGVLVHIPLPATPLNPLRNLTFDRVPSYLWTGDRCVNSEIVAAGLASATKTR